MAIELSEKQIKDGWQVVKFGEIAKHISKRVEPSETDLDVYVGLEHLDPQSLRITRRGVPADVKGQKLRVRPGQIIFGKRRAYQKKVAVADFEGICSAHAMVLEEVVGKIISGLLPFFMQSDMFMDRAVAISEGSLSPTIKWRTLAIQEFPLPPIERQKEILEVLEKAQRCIIKTDNSINGILTLKRITISKFFSSKQLKGTAKKVRLKDVFDIVSGQVDPKEEPYASLPHIAPDNISKCTGQLLKYQSAEQDGVTSGKYEFDETWFLYSKIRPNLRKICYPRFRGICSADVYPIKGENGADTEYLFYLMQSEHFNRYAETNSMRSGFPKINRDDLGAYKFFLPDSDQQKSTVFALHNYDELYDSLQTHRRKQVGLTSKYLSEALFGGAQ
jgi:type I restriction enzyme, S subunit